jgi:hypothetical protein
MPALRPLPPSSPSTEAAKAVVISSGTGDVSLAKETNMIRTVCALAVAAVISMAANGPSCAAPIAPLPAVQTETSAITQVYYRHYYYRRHWHPYRYYRVYRPYRYYWGYPYRSYYWGYPYRPYWGWRRGWW